MVNYSNLKLVCFSAEPWSHSSQIVVKLLMIFMNVITYYCSHIFSKHCCAQNYVEQIALETKGDSSQMHLPTASPQTFCSTLRVGEGVRGDGSKYFDKNSCNFMQFKTFIVFLLAIFSGGSIRGPRGSEVFFCCYGVLIYTYNNFF